MARGSAEPALSPLIAAPLTTFVADGSVTLMLGWWALMKNPKLDSPTRPSINVSIDVPELEAGLQFYGEVFGFIETARPFATMAILDANNVTVCMHAKQAGSRSSAGGADQRRYERHWTPVHLDVHVEDFDAVLSKVRAQGGTIESEFRTQGPRPTAFCSDPFGNGFCVMGPRVR